MLAILGSSLGLMGQVPTFEEGSNTFLVSATLVDLGLGYHAWCPRTCRKLASYTLVIARIVSSIPSGSVKEKAFLGSASICTGSPS